MTIISNAIIQWLLNRISSVVLKVPLMIFRRKQKVYIIIRDIADTRIDSKLSFNKKVYNLDVKSKGFDVKVVKLIKKYSGRVWVGGSLKTNKSIQLGMDVNTSDIKYIEFFNSHNTLSGWRELTQPNNFSNEFRLDIVNKKLALATSYEFKMVASSIRPINFHRNFIDNTNKIKEVLSLVDKEINNVNKIYFACQFPLLVEIGKRYKTELPSKKLYRMTNSGPEEFWVEIRR